MTTDPRQVALLAASYAIAASHGTAGAVIFTDSEYAIATYKADVMASTLRGCRHCSVLQVVDYPLAGAQINVAAPVTALLDTYGKRFTYLLAINGAYITGARVALLGAGRQPDQPPYGVAAGDGDASEFARIRAGSYQKATVAEPLNLQGWQLIDELNRARAGQPPSGYVAPPHLVTTSQRAERHGIRSAQRLPQELSPHLASLNGCLTPHHRDGHRGGPVGGRHPTRRWSSMKQSLPVSWHPTGRSRYGLVEWVIQRRSELRPVAELLALVVPEPVFARLEAPDDRVVGSAGMAAGVLARGAVATTDMTALGTTPQVEPPAIRCQALDAAGTAGQRRRVDGGIRPHDE